MDDPRGLSDDQLLACIERFAEEERDRLPFFLACLGEADRRRLPEERGYTSTFDYCVRRLKLSEDESYRRIHAARAAASRPELLSALAGGHLSLSAVSKIAPHVRRVDAPEIIARAEGKSTRELEEILAPLCPEPAKRDRIRTVATAIEDDANVNAPAVQSRVEFSFQGSIALRNAIERVKDILSNKFPFGEMDHVLLEVVEYYIERHDPQASLALGLRGPVRGRSSIPAAIRRAVWARDGGRCAFVGPAGIRCQSRRMLELDHRKPRSVGGPDTVENLRLLCRPHNDAERRRILGEGKLSTNLARAKSVDKSIDNRGDPG
jgi:5-methylcytosine-specific restriction endonuclease McrA